MVYILRQLPQVYYFWLAGVLTLGFTLWAIYLLFFRREKYIDSRGYVVLTKFKELEHRYITKQLLKRNLAQNEVVHHINGRKTDNQIDNLCLMDREKHEHFHAWLEWKFKKSGRYPTIQDQKRILESDYEGTLLESVGLTLRSGKIESIVEGSAKSLFTELRNLRKQIADEKGIPVYKVFDNRTLTELSEEQPESESEMLEIWGVGPAKVQMYGQQFLDTIKKFKYKANQNHTASKRSKLKTGQ